METLDTASYNKICRGRSVAWRSTLIELSLAPVAEIIDMKNVAEKQKNEFSFGHRPSGD